MKWMKIKSRRGVSILIGLLVFVVCSCVALAIVSGASASSGRLSAYREQENAYLVTKSTVVDISSLLKNKTFQIIVKTDGTCDVFVQTDDNTVDTETTGKGIMPLITKGIAEAAGSEKAYESEIKTEYDFDGTKYTGEGIIVVDEDLNITIRLKSLRPKAYESEGEDVLENAYSTTIRFECAGKKDMSLTTDGKKEVMVYYGQAKVSEGTFDDE